MSPSDQVFRPPASTPRVGARPGTGPGSDAATTSAGPFAGASNANQMGGNAMGNGQAGGPNVGSVPMTAPMTSGPAAAVAGPGLGVNPAGAGPIGGSPAGMSVGAPPSAGPGLAAGAAPGLAGARPVQTPPRVNGTSTSGQQAAPSGPRRVRLTVARLDPWSVLKLSFLLSVALGIGLVTASVILWEVLHGMGVFDKLNETLRDVGGVNSKLDIYEYVGLSRVVSLSTFVAVINVVIIMALSTLGAVLYNLAGSLVGGLQVTLSDD